jgi:tetratricopeptide (TPR) repeat protein
VAGVDEAAATQLHAALLDNSLIIRDAQAGEPRFGMLQTIWSYAAERLTAGGDDGAARDRHAACYRDLALAAGVQSWGPAQAGWLDRLEREKDNMRLAVQRLLDNRELQSLASVAFALWPFWWIRGHHAEALGWVDLALENRSGTSGRDRARLLFVAGSLRIAAGRNADVATQLDESIRLARDAADQHTLACALTQRGFAAVSMGQPDLAGRVLDEADAVSRSQGDPYVEAIAAVARAHTLIAAGQARAADELLASREQETRSLGAEWILAVTLNTRGRAELLEGDAAGAEARLREAAAICGRLRDTWAIRYTITHLADGAALQGDAVRAALLYGPPTC